MRKLFLLAAVFAAGLAVTSCSESQEEAAGGGNKLTGEDEAFIALRINTPATSENAKTRAGETYTPDDGDASEYAVNDGIIVFFGESEETADETKAVVVSAYMLPGLNKASDPKTDEVTTQYTSTLNVTEAGLGGYTHRYALVLLNTQNYFSVNDVKQLLIDGKAFTGEDATFTKLMQTRIPVAKLGNGTEFANGSRTTVGDYGLLMTTAPLATTNDDKSGTVRYMTPITDANIKASEALAKDAPLSVHVERAAAKVQVVQATGLTKLESSKLGDANAEIKIKELTWMPDNLAPNFNFVREVNASDLNIVKTGGSTYRYTGGTAVHDTEGKLYRTTWAVDQLGYTSQLEENALTNLGGQSPTLGLLASNGIAYIPENTMDYNMMYQRNTSRIIIKVKMWDGTKENVDFFSTNILDVNKLYTKTAIEEKLKTYANGLASAVTSSGGTFSYTITPNAETGKATLQVTTTGSENLTTWNAALAKIDINYYKEGVCWYKLQIKHYHPGPDAADEVKEAVTDNGPKYNNVYKETNSGTQKADYLGLYGVVRNTWYIITISKINYAGTPLVPVVPKDTPDDEVNSYISAKINVMQWAKRSQSAEL